MKKIIKTTIVIEVEKNLKEVEVNTLIEKALQDAGIEFLDFDEYIE